MSPVHTTLTAVKYESRTVLPLASEGAGCPYYEWVVSPLSLLLVVCIVAANLVACGTSKSLSQSLSVGITSDEDLSKLIRSLDCSKCMYRASKGFETTQEDVDAGCNSLPSATLIALAAKPSEEKVRFNCVEMEPFFVPECFAHSRIRFRERVVLRDDGVFEESGIFRVFYRVERDRGVLSGIQILPDRRYLIFSNRDTSLPPILDQYVLNGTKYSVRLDTQYELKAACDLDLQPDLPGLTKITGNN